MSRTRRPPAGHSLISFAVKGTLYSLFGVVLGILFSSIYSSFSYHSPEPGVKPIPASSREPPATAPPEPHRQHSANLTTQVFPQQGVAAQDEPRDGTSCEDFQYFVPPWGNPTPVQSYEGVARIIEFPKCGRTWMVSMMKDATSYKCPGQVSILHEMLGYSAYCNLEIKLKHTLPHPFTVTPERLWDPRLKPKYHGKKILWLVRDPRDVIVSAYFERTLRGPLWEKAHAGYSYQGSLSEYIQEASGSFLTLLQYFSNWLQYASSHPEDVLIIRYEDTKACPSLQLVRVLTYFGMNVTKVAIDNAVERNSFDRMRQAEIDAALHIHKSVNKLGRKASLLPANLTDTNSFKTRQGEVGGYRKYFNETEVSYLNNLMAA